MAITLSHQTALDVVRALRAEGENLQNMEAIALANPSAWVGERLNARNFDSSVWRWQQPKRGHPLHILVPGTRNRMRGTNIVAHTKCRDMPAGSVLWLDEHSSVVCPELLFLQMADIFSFPALVMLGYELCGHFSRDAREPLMGTVTDGIPAATSVASIEEFLATFKRVHGLATARRALRYICDHAMSAPEAVLATIYSLPTTESGYGMGPVTLNDCVRVNEYDAWTRDRSRYPDLMFGFAPMGINYDGSKHFDVAELMSAVDALMRAETSSYENARAEFKQKLLEVRAKVLDDNMRNRELASQGRIVFPATKEDLADGEHLDTLTRQVLSCAHKVFGADVNAYLRTLENTSQTRDRYDLLSTLVPMGYLGGTSYGKM